MSALPSVSSHQHWFFYLGNEGKKAVTSTLIAENKEQKELLLKQVNGKTCVVRAGAWLNWNVKRSGAEPYRDADVDQVIKLLNDAALNKVPQDNPAKVVFTWKKHVDDLTGFVSGVKTLSYMSMAGAVGAAGMGILYRSHKVLLVANLSVICALCLFRYIALTLATAGESLKAVVEKLTVESYNDFDTNLNAAYEGLEKTSYLMRLYLPLQRKTISGKSPSQQLFKKQLLALSLLRSTIRRCKKGSDPLQQKDANIGNIKTFFQNFEKICSKGTLISVGFTVLGAALIYQAYMRKAYLMILAGTVHCVVSLLITKEFFRLQSGAKKVYTAADTQIAKTFAEMVPTSMVLSAMRMQDATVYDIEQFVVIPFNKILALVPGWETPIN